MDVFFKIKVKVLNILKPYVAVVLIVIKHVKM